MEYNNVIFRKKGGKKGLPMLFLHEIIIAVPEYVNDRSYFVSQILPEIIQLDIDELLSVDAYFLILTLIHREYHRIFDHVTATLYTYTYTYALQYG